MKVLKYSNSCIVVNHIACISKEKKSREYFSDNRDRFLLIFHMINEDKEEIYFDSREKRDEEYDEVISVIESI